jgi:hypothetical protein
MGIPADELCERMSVGEFTEHWAEYLADPWGEQRADLRSGIVAALIFNSHRGRDQSSKSAADFMPYRKQEDESEVRKRFFKKQKQRTRRR